MKPRGTTKTTRLRRLECEAPACGNLAYQSRARIGQGVMLCPCGARMIPSDPDDAALVLSAAELEDHPAVQKYAECLANAMHGQAPHWKAGRAVRSPDERAQETYEEWRRGGADANRLAALKAHSPFTSAAPAADDAIPF